MMNTLENQDPAFKDKLTPLLTLKFHLLDQVA